MNGALGLIEVIGMATAVSALDAACKNADVKLVGCNKVIGAGKSISVTIQIAGQVAAVRSAVDAGVEAANKVGKVLAHHVMPRPHEELEKLIFGFNAAVQKKQEAKAKTSDKNSQSQS
ncbi:MAG: BMC domain-containing protein [Bacillota bacterium]